ncbi:hypothetical protein GYMLUDRAFT_41990 [Collybiopsis luxurians FD-317 M1]|uniref:histidine kinase n=1 Tax=Collybiopsis luxurians FD-317 M1 TaxID=944289 RepID=A0A0D0C357_9AGAR|nr:hypothetical protein GYMLUDRAFT_41990 [Collybiopsis luxurians FD-317 M1]
MQYSSSHLLNGSSSQKLAQPSSGAASDASASSSTLPMHTPKRARKSSRPATAPAKEDVALLPSLSLNNRKQLLASGNLNYNNMQTLNEDDRDTSSSDCTSSRPGSVPTTPFEPPGSTMPPSGSNMASMYEATAGSNQQSEQPVSIYRHNAHSYDWAVFISAYAAGRWDPHKTPNPPSGSIGGPSLHWSRFQGGSAPETPPAGNYDADDDDPMQVRTPTASNPSSEANSSSNKTKSRLLTEPKPSHRLRNSFSSASGASRKSQPVPLGSSLSAGAPGDHTGYEQQKGRAGLFLKLPSLLSLNSTSGSSPGLEISPTSPAYNVALQSNALHTNSHHGEVKPTSKPNPVHSSSEPVPMLDLELSATSNLHPSNPKPSTSFRSPVVSGYPASATAAHFTPYHLPVQYHPSYNSSSSSSSSASFRPTDFPNAPTLNAATLRLAGTHVNISPLALPSPEHELTDPMRAAGASGRIVTVTVPGTVPEHDADPTSEFDEAGNLSDGVLIDGDVNGANGSSSKDLFRLHGYGSSGDLKKQQHGSGDGGSWEGKALDGGGSGGGGGGRGGYVGPGSDMMNGVVTTPGGTTRRIRISQELKKFWEGMMDVDEPSGSYAYDREEDDLVAGDARKGKVVKIQAPEGHDDYFTRGREFSAAHPQNQYGAPAPKVILPASEIDTSAAFAPSLSQHSDQVDPAEDLTDAAAQKLSISDTEPLTSSPQPTLTTFSSSSASSATKDIGKPVSAPPSVPIPTPLLSAYTYPYPHVRSHVVMHPTGSMTAPVPATLSEASSIASTSYYSSSSSSSSLLSQSSSHADSFAGNNSNSDSNSNPMLDAPARRIALMRQVSAPLPVGSGSSVMLGGKMGIGMPMPPQVLPSLSDVEKSEMLLLAADTAGATASGNEVGGAGMGMGVASEELSPLTPLNPSVLEPSANDSQIIQNQGRPASVVDKAKGGPTAGSSSSATATGTGASGSGTLSNSGSMEAMSALINAGQSPSMRAAKEEQSFRELGYLAAPYPPDEVERRRALYKFNIWNTGSDLNFDRIAHLAKLVFNTKGVFISLVDGHEQWVKSEWGLKVNSSSRASSFCAHAILQRDDEPMVILDTLQDWRFANNPHVVGAPHLRFYAGAPLRTQDGHNVGSLAVIDDAPREEFTPRHRHTLKEFAAIAMREMELWRDKIQLRIRDRIQNSMEQFSRECLEIDMDQGDSPSSHDSPETGPAAVNQSHSLSMSSSMDRVYDRAAKLVQRTLDVEGVIVMDVSHCEVLENMSGESTINVVMHHGDPDVTETTTRSLTADEYAKLNAFFAKNPDGSISEGIVPHSFRLFLPTTRIQYALTVPIFNIDKRPFALLCAYNASDHTKRFLEGHELSYLRAIGVIILSAVLKRRMLLADKAKSLFISNISHELRTPLHGILAAAELLGESDLNHSQSSFLQTVQACGTSLVETVNHVLDFTKLSGNSKAGGVENVILPTKVDLMQLVEEAVDGCWIGHRARTAIMEDSGTGIGSVYSPPKEDDGKSRQHVEAIIDIGEQREGWLLKCEKGGIRRVLMNVFGNSLKFTSDGFVHVILRQLPHAEGDAPNKVKVELAVHDTGKGISQNFLKNQLFHPFSQENPLQTGTGLGLAIVNSIVTSDSVGGKVDVWSEENVGTEIKVTFSAEVVEGDSDAQAGDVGPLKLDDAKNPPTVSLVGFDSEHPGVKLLRSVLKTYLTSWWGLETLDPENSEFGDILILNEDVSYVVDATNKRDTSRPFIVLTALRGNPAIMSVASEHELIGGFCRLVYKPGGPSRLRSVLKLCLHAIKIGSQSRPSSFIEERQVSHQSFGSHGALSAANLITPRRNSEESHLHYSRPSMSPRSTTAHPNGASSWKQEYHTVAEEKPDTPDPDTNEPTITLDSGGTLLKSSIGSIDTKAQKLRVLIIEDNVILRGLLVKWLSKKGYDFRDAVDGRDGVNAYVRDGPFDVVLLDLSMPVLDGIGAAAEIRKLESTSTAGSDNRRSRILALTGMSSLEDKRKAFDAGVDGYLVKPVPFSTLNEVFYKLGIS